jgi:uncharacterized protein YozE (UPF0346 family)
MPEQRQPRTFTSWLRRQVRREDPVGDLARDAVRDPTWPRRTITIDRYRDYFDEREAGYLAVATLDRAWAEWEQAGATPEATGRPTPASGAPGGSGAQEIPPVFDRSPSGSAAGTPQPGAGGPGR